MTLPLVAQRCGMRTGATAQGRWLFRQLDLELTAGTKVAVVGRSGVGKTTLLRLLAGLVTPSEGTITLGARPLHAWSARCRARHIAWLPQRAEPWTDPLAHELVALGRTPHLDALAQQRGHDAHAIETALTSVGALELASRRWSTLSGGERQRIMLARMVASEAGILLLDEPTSALDVGHALRVMNICRELAERGTTVVIATHDLELVQSWADHVICMGTHLHVGRPEDVLTPEIVEQTFQVRTRWGRRLIFESPSSD